MVTWLSKLRKKSDSTKNKVAILISLLITGIIVVFWLQEVSFFTGERKLGNEEIRETVEYQESSPFSLIGAKLSEVGTQVRAISGFFKKANIPKDVSVEGLLNDIENYSDPAGGVTVDNVEKNDESFNILPESETSPIFVEQENSVYEVNTDGQGSLLVIPE